MKKGIFNILTYNIGIIAKPVSQVIEYGINSGDIRWLKHNYKDRFFADPFLFDEDDLYFYILCEEYLFTEEKGKITLLTVDKTKFELIGRQIVIEEETHLSFPFCKKGCNWIIPESCLSGKSICYYIDKNDYSILKREEILNEGIIDSIIYFEESGTQWMYTAKMHSPNTELFVYKKEINEKQFKCVSNNPVMIDRSCTRSAGDFFKCAGVLYRPVQDCVKKYGHRTKIMRIDSIGSNGYSANFVTALDSFNNPPYNETMHTFNVYDNCIIVDGSMNPRRFPVKIIYKLVKYINTKRKRKNEH